jgi:uncharacterized membrane protein YphA (DoxX/SURF4 family)
MRKRTLSSNRWFQSKIPWQAVLARGEISSAFLSSVADRFGLWGPPGSRNASWGDFRHFIAYTAQVNSFLPPSVIPFLAWCTTAFEVACGVGVLFPGKAGRFFAWASGCLLALFALAMTLGTGIKSVLSHSVLTATAAAFLLAREGPPAEPQP